MITGIPKEYHIIVDAGYIPLVWLAPKLFNFNEEAAVAAICKASSVADVVYTLLTDAEWGVIKVIPYKTHALLDAAQGAVALAAFATLPIKNKCARNTLIAMGFAGLIVGALSYIGSKYIDD